MAGAWTLLVPSVLATDGDAEGLPSVVPEAMAQGCPVIGSAEGGIAEAVRDGVSGLLVPAGDPVDLAAAMRRMVQVPALRQTLGQGVRRGRAAVERASPVGGAGGTVVARGPGSAGMRRTATVMAGACFGRNGKPSFNGIQSGMCGGPLRVMVCAGSVSTTCSAALGTVVHGGLRAP